MRTTLRVFGFACIGLLVGGLTHPLVHETGFVVGFLAFITATAIDAARRERRA